MSAQRLLDQIAQRGFLEARVLEKVRAQVANSPKEVSAESLAKVLVKKGQLTTSQAKQLLDAMSAAPPPLPDDHFEDLGFASDDNELLPVDDEIVEPVEDEFVDPVNNDIVDPVEENVVDLEKDDNVTPVVNDDLADVELLEDVDVVEPIKGPPSVSTNSTVVIDTDDDLGDELPEEFSGRTVSRKRSFISELLQAVRGGGKQKKYTANRWDSPLMLVGGGSLLILIAVGIALYFFLTRGTGDDAFKLATESYRQQAYDKAISQYETFLDRFPGHPKESAAVVQIGMAQIWRQVDQQRWDEALETSREVLPGLVAQEAFNDARPELATMLPEIMEGFADRATAAETISAAEQDLELANQAFEEVNNSAYLPTSVRSGQQPRIEQIVDDLESVRRRINEDRELDKAVAEIISLANQGEIAAAYDLRKQLLRSYPSVELDERLVSSIRSVTLAEQAAVKPVTEPPEPSSGSQADPTLFTVVLADHRGDRLDDLAGEIIIISTNGSVFGLNAEDGSVRWRYPVGYDAPYAPLSLETIGSSDVIVVRQFDHQLVRLSADTGQPTWWLPCPGQIVSTQLTAGRLIIACSTDQRGWVFFVDPDSGQVKQGVELPVPLSTGPVVDQDHQRLIQPASYATLYSLNLNDLACRGVSYLGHGKGTVVVPPVLAGGALILAENPGVGFSLVHVLKDREGQAGGEEHADQFQSMMDPVRVEGEVITPLNAVARRVLLVTDYGQIRVFEVDLNQPSSPLRLTAEATSAVSPGTQLHVLLERGRLWVGDSQLSRYELQTSRGQLVRKWINSKGDLFLAPMQLKKNVLFHVRQRSGRTGATVAAVATGSGDRREGESIWETDVAVPPAGEPFVDREAKEINVVTGNAALFAVGSRQIRAGVDQSPRHKLVGPDLFPLANVVSLSNGRHVYVSEVGSDRVVTLTGNGASARLNLVTLDVGTDRSVATIPVGFRDALMIATRSGTVEVFDAESGLAVLAPFQPPIESGTTTNWLQPTTLMDDQEAILSDARGQLFHLTVADDPQPHVTALRQNETDAAFVAPPVVVGESIYAPVRGSEGDVLRRFALADLTLQDQVELSGRLLWGPLSAGEIGLVMTDQGELIGFDGRQTRFTAGPLAAPLVGKPTAFQGGVVVATVNGEVMHFDSDGTLITKLQLPETLGTGPVLFSENRFIICGGDGTLHVVAVQ